MLLKNKLKLWARVVRYLKLMPKNKILIALTLFTNVFNSYLKLDFNDNDFVSKFAFLLFLDQNSNFEDFWVVYSFR